MNQLLYLLSVSFYGECSCAWDGSGIVSCVRYGYGVEGGKCGYSYLSSNYDSCSDDDDGDDGGCDGSYWGTEGKSGGRTSSGDICGDAVNDGGGEGYSGGGAWELSRVRIYKPGRVYCTSVLPTH